MKFRTSVCPRLPGVLITLMLILISACEKEQSGTAAPLNELSVLQKLADAYEKMSDQVSVSPANLAPRVRKKFVEQVFTQAGYSYTKTLARLAQVSPAEITKLHRDMQELLFLPHYGHSTDIMKEIYSEEERLAIEKIKTNFN